MDTSTLVDFNEEELALAQAQADKDLDLLAAASAKAREKRVEPEPVTERHMNRAERRAQVKYYAKLLAETERQEPIRNATIIPRAKRRRQKGGRRA